MRRYKVILADDHSLIRSGLRRELEDAGDVQIVAEAATGAQLLSALEDHACQLVVVDLAMPEMNGLEALAVVRERFPDVQCVVLTGFTNYATEARRLGVCGYLLKSEPAERVADVVRSILKGGPVVYSAGVGTDTDPEGLLGTEATPEAVPGVLSKRELQILRCLAQGLKHSEIAARLGVVERTVEFHKSNIKAKLKLNNNARLIQYAVHHGLTGPAQD